MTEPRLHYSFANRSHKAKGAWYAYVSYVWDSPKKGYPDGITAYIGQRGYWFNPLKWEVGINLDLTNKMFDLNLGIFYFNVMIG